MKMKQFTVMVCDGDERRQAWLRRLLSSIVWNKDYEFQVDWITDENEEVVERHGKEAHMAFLYVGEQTMSAIQNGKWILNSNIHCQIVFYGSKAVDLYPYFQARPVAVMRNTENKEDRIRIWTKQIEDMCTVVEGQRQCFKWDSKQLACIIPYNMLLYIQSQRTLLQLALVSGRVYEVPGKLDGAQMRLEKDTDLFLRVHQSFLVNMSKVMALDKGKNMLLLLDGSQIPVSKRYIKEVRNRLEGS